MAVRLRSSAGEMLRKSGANGQGGLVSRTLGLEGRRAVGGTVRNVAPGDPLSYQFSEN